MISQQIAKSKPCASAFPAWSTARTRIWRGHRCAAAAHRRRCPGLCAGTCDAAATSSGGSSVHLDASGASIMHRFKAQRVGDLESSPAADRRRVIEALLALGWFAARTEGQQAALKRSCRASERKRPAHGWRRSLRHCCLLTRTCRLHTEACGHSLSRVACWTAGAR